MVRRRLAASERSAERSSSPNSISSPPRRCSARSAGLSSRPLPSRSATVAHHQDLPRRRRHPEVAGHQDQVVLRLSS